MSAEYDPLRIDPVFLRIRRVLDEGQRSRGVGDRIGEGEFARASEATPVVEDERIPAVPTDRLRDILIVLKAGQAMHEDHGRMGLGAGRHIEGAEHRAVTAWDYDPEHRGRRIRVWRWISDNGLRQRRGRCTRDRRAGD